jgi:hypothetical protein
MVNRSNCITLFDDCLRSKKLKFSQIYIDNAGCNYEIFLGSMNGYVQMEYFPLDSDDESITCTFYSKTNSTGMSLYESCVDSDNMAIDFEEEIDNLVDGVKKLNQAISKIEIKIDQIIEICEEHQLDLNNFIEIIYNF